MKKITVGIITLSDGREYLHTLQRDVNLRYQSALQSRLEGAGFETVCFPEPVRSNREAQEAGKFLRQAGAEVTVFNYAIWCYPQFTAVAAQFAPPPYVLFCNLHPSECGMVGMLAASGTLEQLGKVHFRVWGDIGDPDVCRKLLSCIRAGAAVNRLRGNTYGNFGGRAMGMYTAVADAALWQRKFGIDVEPFEQEDIVRASARIPQKDVTRARVWLEHHAKQVAYNSSNFTPQKLELQIRSYLALRALIDERGLDFIDIKSHGDLTDRFVTMDLAEAFLNDCYDWNGAHEPFVAATESDMDGALTMQIFKYMTGQPVLFADVRHYERSKDVWFFSNSGTSATYYAAGSCNAEENLRQVSLLPETKDYPAGGGSVHYFAKAGEMTFARLARRGEEYFLTVVPADIVQFSEKEMARLGSLATPQWPLAFAKLRVSADVFLAQYPCNHIHGVYGEWTQEWQNVAKILNIPVSILA